MVRDRETMSGAQIKADDLTRQKWAVGKIGSKWNDQFSNSCVYLTHRRCFHPDTTCFSKVRHRSKPNLRLSRYGIVRKTQEGSVVYWCAVLV